MSQLQNIMKELRDISNQIVLLVENESWDVFDEIVEMIRLFGENIHSNGIRTKEDVFKLQNIKKDNKKLFANIVYDNLQLLIKEYESLIAIQHKNQIVFPFVYLGNKMAVVKQHDENYYFLNEVDLEFERLKSTISNETEAIILIGYGSGTLHERLSKNYHVLTIDPFKLPSIVKSTSVLSFIESGKNNKSILQSQFQSFVGLKTEVIKHPLYKNTLELLELLKLVRSYLNECHIDLNTRKLYTEKWYVEYFYNTIFLKENTDRLVNIDYLKQKYNGTKALMIAGGPSLEEAIPYLQKAQNSYYIVAIGQTVKALTENGIRPDFVISTDAGEANAYFFKDIELDVPLVYSLQVNHQIPKQSKGVLIPYADSQITKELLAYSKTKFNTYPTVALAAVAFSYHLGFDSIGLIGQDLALRNGEYYSASVKQASSTDGQFHDMLYDIELNNGDIGKTTPVLFGFLSNYQFLIKTYPGLSRKLINYAEQGAVIEGVTYEPLETLKEEPIQKQNIEKVEEKEIYIPIEHVQDLLNSVIQRLQNLKQKLYRIMNQKAVTVNEFEKVLRGWDAMIETPSFRSHIMPLQLVNLLIIQNKIKLHNRYNQTSAMRLSILSQMFDAIQELENQIYTIKQTYVDNNYAKNKR
ncbi:motility associated factor glycosyltransferase family protein [Exiguobacterium sp. MH3]|uniref:motility associated factor glycosyltransferase family protein n=1 Tax=Exiguobacterium sp. MH3 TaxID=1399115 RepID=UPI0003C3C305|nr:6-hydroxymethylpterin diphosphokinase MptE-like protein [Exiguobacterium sp. MH3]AHA31507.1 hypothetical protein U719_13450 [Exiguobacterium sp. MH3]